MMFRAVILTLCGLSAALAQQDPPVPPPPAAAAPASAASGPGECSADSSNPFASLLCAAKTKLAEWEKVDHDLSPQINQYCDRQRAFRVVKTLQDSRKAADEALVTYFEERKQFVDEQIGDLLKKKETDNDDLNRKIAKTKMDLDQNNALLDQKKKELDTIPANATDTYKASIKEVIRVLAQQAEHLQSTVQALQDTIDNRGYIEKEWANQQIIAQKMMEDARSNGEAFLARYTDLAELQLSRCVAGVAGSDAQKKP